jgi:hypothetical protein
MITHITVEGNALKQATLNYSTCQTELIVNFMAFSFKWNLLSYKTGAIPECLVFVGSTLQSQHLIGL